MTDLYDALYRTMRDPNNLAKTSVEGSRIYYDMQDFNNGLLKAGIGLILGSCLLFLTNTHTRRKYYIGNYCAITANVAANKGIAIWAHSQIEAFKAQFVTSINFEQLKEFAESRGSLSMTADSTFWFDVHYLVFGITLAAAVLLVINTVWKISLMREEKKLIAVGKEVAV